MSVWVMPSVDVYENFLKRSQAVADGGQPHMFTIVPICLIYCSNFRSLVSGSQRLALGPNRASGTDRQSMSIVCDFSCLQARICLLVPTDVLCLPFWCILAIEMCKHTLRRRASLFVEGFGA